MDDDLRQRLTLCLRKLPGLGLGQGVEGQIFAIGSPDLFPQAQSQQMVHGLLGRAGAHRRGEELHHAPGNRQAQEGGGPEQLPFADGEHRHQMVESEVLQELNDLAFFVRGSTAGKLRFQLLEGLPAALLALQGQVEE